MIKPSHQLFFFCLLLLFSSPLSSRVCFVVVVLCSSSFALLFVCHRIAMPRPHRPMLSRTTHGQTSDAGRPVQFALNTWVGLSRSSLALVALYFSQPEVPLRMCCWRTSGSCLLPGQRYWRCQFPWRERKSANDGWVAKTKDPATDMRPQGQASAQ